MNQENNFNQPMNFDPQTGTPINVKRKKVDLKIWGFLK